MTDVLMVGFVFLIAIVIFYDLATRRRPDRFCRSVRLLCPVQASNWWIFPLGQEILLEENTPNGSVRVTIKYTWVRDGHERYRYFRLDCPPGQRFLNVKQALIQKGCIEET